ncbi:LytTR family DNA-binding domain-containing protein [uncultured Draconibacterium sp.]|uniref:LytTR family DNA-binding domain-containing protein n=1 Tax=uncultured Draconibacterium sp. TaxID=1573823 RepID=UPI0025F8D28D|nr:LytTR family DNA-binding domain-containing protein [uncultured Draconibacterium sp.]
MQKHDSRLVLSSSDYFYLFEKEDIVFCEELDDQTTINLQNGQQFRVAFSLDELKQKINRTDFFQPQSNCLVNAQYVSRVQQIAGIEVLLKNGRVIRVSPKLAKEVLQFFEKFTRIQI